MALRPADRSPRIDPAGARLVGEGLTMRALRKRPATPEPSYEVGYAKPPAHSRFQPGQSGNPLGRPRGAGAAKHRLPALNEERLKTVVIAEAYRTIGVRDGDKLVEIPVIQAIIRSVALNAAKGDRRSQRMFAELLQWVERENKALSDEWLQTAIEYKTSWDEELHRRERLGVTGPEPLPHPDDIVINMNTGLVEIKGPMTREEKAKWERVREIWQDGVEIIALFERKIAERPRDKALRRELENLRRTQARIETMLPRRWQIVEPEAVE